MLIIGVFLGAAITISIAAVCATIILLRTLYKRGKNGSK